ncbi:hypothetical protein LAZ67_6003172 [Cordylochernes scorpioides]|uniref:Peptidase A2 domain-containing protein n=1 Tax=Cordylochernes scorpioides TaxID=51811 RepID=A0ABY6KKB8_9ARAC|nr:hypothetical protein LAZ67_6003172 [Cordylochernes scorpioides]
MVEINERKTKALVDSGADFSVISDKFRRELKTPLFKEPGPILKAANKNLIETLGKCVLNIEVDGLKISFEFVVMVECSHDIIFGWDFFKAKETVIDCGRNELHLGETSILESREEENQILFASDDFVIPPKSIKNISVINEEICAVSTLVANSSICYGSINPRRHRKSRTFNATSGVSSVHFDRMTEWTLPSSGRAATFKDVLITSGGRPPTAVTQEKNELVRFFLREDRIITYQKLEKSVGIGSEAINTTINDHLKYRKLEGHILDMNNEEQISAPILKPSQIT